LVVDDNDAHNQTVFEYLTDFGCIPHIVRDRDTAFDMLNKEGIGRKIQLILVDAYLPGLSGFDFARKIREDGRLRKIPIILMTAMASIGDGKACRDVGIGGYLIKPLEKKDLQITMGNVLQMAQSTGNEARSLVTKHSIKEAQGKGIRILLAEDYPTNQQIAMKHLQGAGYDVVLAENGIMAVSLFKKRPFDLVLMDIQMPEMDGHEATRQIRNFEQQMAGSHSLEQMIPIIAMTAHALEGYQEKCIQGGMNDYISKPLKKDNLLAIANKWTMNIKTRATDKNDPADFSLTIEKNWDQTGNPVPMDIPKAIEEFENDDEFFKNMLDEFIQNVDEQLKIIKSAVASGDFQRIEAEAHAIKGGAANLIAHNLSKAAYLLEKAGRDENKTLARDLFEKLNDAFVEFCDFINQSNDI
ncbi:MAG: response regulator, partial [Desulfobacteraceae bacterium]|nr:response regulator [Desulfobacteraceae bacterium]